MQGSADDEGDSVARSVTQWQEVAPELDTSAMEVFGRIHLIFLRYQAQLARVFGRHGINPAAFGALAALYRAGEPYRLMVTKLGQETLISSGGISLRLDRLEDAGLIVRERDREDRRVVFAELTARGLEVVKSAAVDHFSNESRMLAGLSERERATLAALLSKLAASLEDYPADDEPAERARR